MHRDLLAPACWSAAAGAARGALPPHLGNPLEVHECHRDVGLRAAHQGPAVPDPRRTNVLGDRPTAEGASCRSTAKWRRSRRRRASIWSAGEAPLWCWEAAASCTSRGPTPDLYAENQDIIVIIKDIEAIDRRSRQLGRLPSSTVSCLWIWTWSVRMKSRGQLVDLLDKMSRQVHW